MEFQSGNENEFENHIQVDDDIKELLEDTSWDDFVLCDDEVQTFSSELANENESNFQIQQEEDPCEDVPRITLEQALKSLQNLQNFALQNSSPDLLKIRLCCRSLLYLLIHF